MSRYYHMPPPLAGLNARDGIPVMKEKYATDILNFYPGDNGMELRRGYQDSMLTYVIVIDL